MLQRFLLCLCVVLSACVSRPSSAARGTLPWASPAEGWRTDPVWYDGQAEVCTYDATRTIYGIERRYVATAYTNKQRMDPATTTKAEGEGGVEVFKHHWSERVPTERYDYDFSTAVFCRTDDLAPWKLQVGTQEDCGASFKLVWTEDGSLEWLESVYFPGGGLRQGRLDPGGLQLVDALSLVLRDAPFPGAGVGPDDEAGPRRLGTLRLLPSQKDTHRVPFEPVELELVHEGRETLELPAGRILTERLGVRRPGDDASTATYWFAAEGGAPWLHALVRYEGPGGVSYRLRGLERKAYWKR